MKKKITKKIENKESTTASSSGSFDAPIGTIKQKKITKIHNKESEIAEVTDASSSGAFDAPFGGGGTKGRKNPLKIDGPKSIYKGRAVKDKNFPRFGGPDGKYVKIDDKCKKYPYCNQGDMSIFQIMEQEDIKQLVKDISKDKKIPLKLVESVVKKQLSKIFI